MAKKRMGCLGTLLTTLLVIVIIVVIAVIVVGNLTPENIGVADAAIFNGQSLRDIGLADTKIKEIVPIILSLVNTPKESEIVTNAPTQEDGESADTKLQGSSIIDQTTGKPDYTGILDGQVTFQQKSQLDIKDTELAYIFNSLLASGTEQADVEVLTQLNAEIKEISIYSQDGKIMLRSVIAADISQYVDSINIPLVKLSNTLYLTVYNEVSVDDQGIISTTAAGLAINGQDERISGLILNGVLAAVSGEGQTFTQTDICDGVGELFSTAMKNLGKVGKYVEPTETLGIGGIDADNHVISLVTYAA